VLVVRRFFSGNALNAVFGPWAAVEEKGIFEAPGFDCEFSLGLGIPRQNGHGARRHNMGKRTMAVEWLGLARFAVSSVKSLYDYSFGQSPHMNFEAGDYGVKLRIGNPRTETIIVETIDGSPSILGFSPSHEIDDLARAIATHRQIRVEEVMAVVSPKADVVISVLTFDPFGVAYGGV
jgi:hypothetical protein